MKIILISTGYYDYVIQQANALATGEECMLMMIDSIPEEYLSNLKSEVRLYLFKHPRRMYYPTIFAMILRMRNQINSFNPDVVHMQVGGIFPCFLPPFIRRYPVVSTFHDVIPHPGIGYPLYERFMNYCAMKFSSEYIVHGQNLKKEMIRRYHIPADKINVQAIGEIEVAPFKKFENANLHEDGNLVLFFGKILEYKGLDYLINAEPLITKELPNVKIVIAGNGKLFKKYEKMLVNKESFIIYNHYIPPSLGASLFQRASIVVLPYVEASQSGVVPPAYSFRKPVIATNVGSLPEIVDDGITGLIVPPKDSPALAAAIVKLMKDKKLREQMGENAYKKLKTDLSWDRIAIKTIEVYRKAMRHRKLNPGTDEVIK